MGLQRWVSHQSVSHIILDFTYIQYTLYIHAYTVQFYGLLGNRSCETARLLHNKASNNKPFFTTSDLSADLISTISAFGPTQPTCPGAQTPTLKVPPPSLPVYQSGPPLAPRALESWCLQRSLSSSWLLLTSHPPSNPPQLDRRSQ